MKALTTAGFHAVHIPKAYGGQGTDSVATCIVIEGVARVDASAALIPAVNKLGTMGLILNGSEELKKKALPDLALSFISSACKCFASDVAMSVTIDAVQLFDGPATPPTSPWNA